MATVKGILFWNYTNSLDLRYNQWKTTVVIDAQEAKRLKTLGLKPKMVDALNDDEEMVDAGAYKITFTRKLYKKGKNPGINKPPQAVLQKEDGTKEYFNGIIGNGSEGIVSFRPYEWSNSFGKGIGADFRGVVVTSLVPFGDGEDGYSGEEEDEELFGDVQGTQAEFEMPEEREEEEADGDDSEPESSPDEPMTDEPMTEGGDEDDEDF